MQLIWFRNDLRLEDNPALTAACSHAEPVTAVVCLTPAQWAAHHQSPARIAYWQARLNWLETELAARHIQLVKLSLQHFSDCPRALLELARTLKAKALHYNHEYPLHEQRRDQVVCQMLNAAGIATRGYHGDLILPPGSVQTLQGTPFKVFTPFSRAWRRLLLQTNPAPLPAPGAQIPAPPGQEAVPHHPADGDRGHWPVSQQGILIQLRQFLEEREEDYAQARDFPALNGTSGLSPALSIGALSAQQCLAALQQKYSDDRWLESSWLNELIWREFYRHLLDAFPGLSRLEPFRPEVEARITWLNRESDLEAWKVGETGYPIVDAAMKQLLATGWMHNRLRMVSASFLTRLLRVDWRQGEAFFMSKLIDGDFASNLGGWSWCASVGADAAPYFRIFNPQRQSERFDPQGEFIAHWLPELAALPPRERHQPGAGQHLGRPAPIVDYKRARQSALDDYNR